LSFLGGAPIFRTFHHSKFSPVDAGSVALAALHVHNRDNRNEEQLKVTTENGRGRLAHTSSQRRCLCTTWTIKTSNKWKLQRRTDEEDWLIQAVSGAACAQQGQSKRGTTGSYNGGRTRKTGSYYKQFREEL